MVASPSLASTSGLTLSMLSPLAKQAPRGLRAAGRVARPPRVTAVPSRRLLSSVTPTRPGASALSSSRLSPLPLQPPPSPLRQAHRSLSLLSKRPEAPEEPDVYQDGRDPSLNLTDRAIAHLSRVAQRESNDRLGLRVMVEPGGCHGYQYKMDLMDAVADIEEDDFVFAYPQANKQQQGDDAAAAGNVYLVVDSVSLRLIKGSTIDYVTELIGSQFSILDNPQAKGAGCGCGVSWEPNF